MGTLCIKSEFSAKLTRQTSAGSMPIPVLGTHPCQRWTLHRLHASPLLSNTLRHGLPKENKHAILATILAGGQDPLDVGYDTLGVLWIL